jgi:flavodoxin
MSHILIAYFSKAGENYVSGAMKELPVGNTARVAAMLQERTGGDLWEIRPREPYPDGYKDCVARSKQELQEKARPALEGTMPDLTKYDTVILGYPIWCGTMPMPVWTFLEAGDFSGKTILPFCTHEGSGLSRSVGDIRALCPQARVGEALAVHGSHIPESGEAMDAWLRSAGL